MFLGTLPFRNYPKEKDPYAPVTMKEYEQCYGPHLPYLLLSGRGQAEQLRGCFPSYEEVLQSVESDFSEIEKWIGSHAKSGSRMSEALKKAKGGVNIAKLLKRACQLPPFRSEENPYLTLRKAIPSLAVSADALRTLPKLFNAKASRLIASLPENEREKQRIWWKKATQVVLKDNPKVPYHLIKQFGKELDEKSSSESLESPTLSKEQESKNQLTLEEEVEETQKAFIALGELFFLLMRNLAAHTTLDILETETYLMPMLFEEDAPKDAMRLFRNSLPSYDHWHMMAMKRIETALHWLERYPSWTMVQKPSVTCLDTLRTIKDAIVKAEVQRKWADDMTNEIQNQWRSRLIDAACINVGDSAKALNELVTSLMEQIEEVFHFLPLERRITARSQLHLLVEPKYRINKKLPTFVKENWRYELDVEDE